MKNLNNYLAEGSEVEGKLILDDIVRIDGTVIGSIESKQEVVFESKGKMKGLVTANTVTVKGLINGDVHSKTKLEVLPGGQLSGNTITPIGGIIVRKGGIVNSLLSVQKETPLPEPTHLPHQQK